MSLSWFSSLLLFALITCGTPGPNNMLLTTAAAHGGFRRSVPLLFAVVGGLNLLMLVTALGVAGIVLGIPGAQLLLKLLGSGYLLWLAWQQGSAGVPVYHDDVRVPTWRQGALLQLMNVKGWIMAFSAIGSFAQSGSAYWPSCLLILLIFFLIGLLTGSLWMGLGMGVGRLIGSARGWKGFNLGMAVLMVGCVVMIWR